MPTKSLFSLITALLAFGQVSEAQSFKKGSLLLSVSGGSTTATYSTENTQTGQNAFSRKMDGIRDPLFVELGIGKGWGIGLSSGNDLFSMSSKDFYGFRSDGDRLLDIKTSEFTFDLNYHLYSGRRTDWSVYTSAGTFGVDYKQQSGENTFNYSAKGGIVRVGTKLRYYFWKRLGALAMLSSYSGSAAPTRCPPTGAGVSNYSTRISGTALEFGLCFRFF